MEGHEGSLYVYNVHLCIVVYRISQSIPHVPYCKNILSSLRLYNVWVMDHPWSSYASYCVCVLRKNVLPLNNRMTQLCFIGVCSLDPKQEVTDLKKWWSYKSDPFLFGMVQHNSIRYLFKSSYMAPPKSGCNRNLSIYRWNYPCQSIILRFYHVCYLTYVNVSQTLTYVALCRSLCKSVASKDTLKIWLPAIHSTGWLFVARAHTRWVPDVLHLGSKWIQMTQAFQGYKTQWHIIV